MQHHCCGPQGPQTAESCSNVYYESCFNHLCGHVDPRPNSPQARLRQDEFRSKITNHVASLEQLLLTLLLLKKLAHKHEVARTRREVLKKETEAFSASLGDSMQESEETVKKLADEKGKVLIRLFICT